MPFCPKCENEYELYVKSCVDCRVELVAKLEEKRTDEEKELAESVQRFFVDDESLVQNLVSALAKMGVPGKALPKDGNGDLSFIVPRAYGSYVPTIFSAVPGLVRDLKEDGKILYRRFDPTRDKHLMEHPILSESIESLAKMGPKAIADLSECVRRGTPAVAVPAGASLLQLGAPGIQAVLNLLIENSFLDSSSSWLLSLIREKKLQSKFVLDESQTAKLREQLKHSDVDTRSHAIHLVDFFSWRQFAPELIALMKDEASCLDADDVLVEWSGEDLDFDFELPEAEKNELIEQRLEWWKQQRANHG